MADDQGERSRAMSDSCLLGVAADEAGADAELMALLLEEYEEARADGSVGFRRVLEAMIDSASSRAANPPVQSSLLED